MVITNHRNMPNDCCIKSHQLVLPLHETTILRFTSIFWTSLKYFVLSNTNKKLHTYFTRTVSVPYSLVACLTMFSIQAPTGMADWTSSWNAVTSIPSLVQMLLSWPSFWVRSISSSSVVIGTHESPQAIRWGSFAYLEMWLLNIS